jgi:hypothetical protein
MGATEAWPSGYSRLLTANATLLGTERTMAIDTAEDLIRSGAASYAGFLANKASFA